MSIFRLITREEFFKVLIKHLSSEIEDFSKGIAETEKFIHDFREMTGQFLISKNEGYDEILDVLRHNGTVAFLADQSAGPKGVWVDFFGHKASAYKAMALLSMQYDAPILICYATRKRDRPMHFNMRELGLFDPRDQNENISGVRGITQWFTNVLENAVREDPDQYWWIHNRWKTYGKKFSASAPDQK